MITGYGAVTPMGLDAASSLDAVRAGRSGIDRIGSFDVSDIPVKIGGEVHGFDPTRFVARGDVRRLDPHALYGIAAGTEALTHAIPGLTPGDELPIDPERVNITLATSAGPVGLFYDGVRALDTRGPTRVLPGVTVYGGADSGAVYLSTRYGARGTTFGMGATCASSTIAIGEALRTIRHGYADAVLVIGAEQTLNRVNLAANANIRALTSDFADEPWRASRPFDRARAGFVMSSGAAAVMIESERSAIARGATILATLLGYGGTSDAYHATAPHPEGAGAARAMQLALADADIEARDIDHVNAHATGTPQGDPSEVLALRRVFAGGVPPVTATKSVTGHMVGAAGAFEAIVSIDALRRGEIPPTMNLDDPEFDLDLVTGSPRRAALRTVLSNSFGFGGHNASLVLGVA